jgi:hypothetical protein
MSSDTPLGEVWGFAQMTSAGKGYWYRIGLGQTDDAGRALAKVITSPFKTFSGDIIVCVHGTNPPGAPPDPSFPIMRRAGSVEEDPDTALGLMWGHSATYKNGKGYYEKAGIGWFDREGRAHGKFHLTINAGFRGYIAICPPGVKPPQDPMPPSFVQPRQESVPEQVEEQDENPEEI